MKTLLDKYKSLSLPLKASLWFLICGILQKGMSVLTTPIFTRLLTTAEYGSVNVYNSWHSIFNIFFTLSLSAGVYAQGLVKYDNDRDKYTSVLLGLTTAICLGFFVVYIAFFRFWNKLIGLSLPLMICMFVSIWSGASYSFWSTRQRVELQYKRLVSLIISFTILYPAVCISGVLLFPNHHVEARIIGATITELLCYGLLSIGQFARGKKLFDKFYWEYALKYNLPLIPHYLSQVVLNSSDRIMIKNLCSENDTGLYSLAYNLAMLMILINTALNSTLGPWLYQKIKDRDYKRIGNVAYRLLFAVAAANLILIAFAPEAVMIFAPSAYYDAIWAIPPVSMSLFFLFMYDLFAKFAFYYEHTSLIMIASVIGAALNLLLNAIFIPIFGYIAAAYTTLVCYMIYSFVHYLLMRYVCKKHADNARVYNPLIILVMSAAFLVCGFAIMLLYEHIIIKYILIAIMLVIILIKRNDIIALIKQLKVK